MAGREYPLERTRNIGIMAHIDACLLYTSPLSRATLANWVIYCAENYLCHVYDYLCLMYIRY